MRFLLVVSILCLLASCATAQTKYFPEGSFSADHQPDEFTAQWYSEQLTALREPSLWEWSKAQSAPSYRFLWLRTFHHPIAIRLDVNANGTSRLTAKMASGKGGYAPGKLVKDVSVTLSKEQTDWFLGKIEEYKFWDLPSTQETAGTVGCDGAQWIVEGIKGRSYRIVERWSPQDGAVRAIGLIMINDLAKLTIKPFELY